MLFRSLHIPGLKKVHKATLSFSLTEKVVFFILCLVFIFSSISLLHKANSAFLIEIPTLGGSFTEGIVGIPRFINPVLAVSEADRELSNLIYSGLMRLDRNGKLVPDLAQSYSISEDGLIYRFTLKDNLKFHDNQNLTTEDIEFTINQIQDSLLKSPQQGAWDGVLIEVIDEKNIEFTLKQPYTPFLENTTIGILPKHIWKNATPEQFNLSPYNTEPIGSGPYLIKDIKTNSVKLPVSYNLESFEDYALGQPHISNVIIKTSPNQESLIDSYNSGDIDSLHSIDPSLISESTDESLLLNPTLPRVFGFFLNQNKNSIFSNIEIRKVLDISVPKDEIVNQVLNGYGSKIQGPVPENFLTETIEQDTGTSTPEEILLRNEWEKNEETGLWEKDDEILQFKIATSNTEDLKQVAQIAKQSWEEIGIKVDLEFFEIGDLKQNIIRPRDYEMLLFGETIGRDLDLFPFWHSSQRNDPGLNIAMYTNITTDKLLEEARQTQDKGEQMQKTISIYKEIVDEIPAIFVYSPQFIYIRPPHVKNIEVKNINTASERFSSIHSWFIETEKVWKIFAK